MNSAAPLLVIVGLLSGCSLLRPDVDIQVTEKAVPVVCSAVTEKPDALDLKDTPPTLVMDPNQVWGYWFNADLYGSLAENLQAMRTWMNQSSSIRNKLVQCIEDHNARVSEDATAE